MGRVDHRVEVVDAEHAEVRDREAAALVFLRRKLAVAGAGGEIQLTDAIQKLLGEEPVMAYRFEGKRYDCGSKLGYLQATVEFALKHPDLKEPFLEYLVEEFGQQARKILRAIND